MYKPTVTEADLARLKDERDQADRQYNEALTAFDQALTRPRPLPEPAAGPDASQLEHLDRLWAVLPPDPIPFTGWRARLAGFVWRMLGPTLQRQQEFNGALVEHIRRSAASSDQIGLTIGDLSNAVAEELRALAVLQSRLITYLQQITLYVDTKDRYQAGEIRGEMEHLAAGLAAGLSAVGDETMKRWESLLARERRLEARLNQARSTVGRVWALGQSPVADTLAEGSEAGSRRTPAPPAASNPTEALASTAEHASIYAGFEDEFRGTPQAIRDRLAEYLPLFAGTSDVVELGCGRGEFLEALRAEGVTARGTDVNTAMVERCRALGLNVTQADALEYLASVADESIGGLFAAQFVEHLPPDRLLALLALARRKLRAGAPIVLETINPACWYAFFSSYIRDITHVRPLHPDTLRYLLTANGFDEADIRYSSPYPKDYKLHPLPLTLVAEGRAFKELVDEFNGNVEKLNELLFTYLDYAAIAVRP